MVAIPVARPGKGISCVEKDLHELPLDSEMRGPDECDGCHQYSFNML